MVRVEHFINRSGPQQPPDILTGHEIIDDVIHFADWGDFSLTQGRFLSRGADPVGDDELVGFEEA
jgi:hypothetical protein